LLERSRQRAVHHRGRPGERGSRGSSRPSLGLGREGLGSEGFGSEEFGGEGFDGKGQDASVGRSERDGQGGRAPLEEARLASRRSQPRGVRARRSSSDAHGVTSRKRRSSGKRCIQKAATTMVPTPPISTAGTAPNSAASTPDSNSPS